MISNSRLGILFESTQTTLGNTVADVEPNTGNDYTPDANGIFTALSECYDDSLRVDQYITLSEVRAFDSILSESTMINDLSSIELINEGTATDFFDKIKKIFSNLWAKIKGIFDKFIKLINGMFLDNKKFVTKYGKEIEDRSRNLKGFEMELHKWKLDSIDNHINESYGKIEKKINDIIPLKIFDNPTDDTVKDIEEKVKDDNIGDTLRGLVINKSGTISSDEYSDELIKLFRDEDTTNYTDGSLPHSVSDMLTTLKSGKIVKSAQKAKTKSDVHFKEVIGFYKKIEQKAKSIKIDTTSNIKGSNKREVDMVSGDSDTLRHLTRLATLAKDAHVEGETVMNGALSAYMTQAKAMEREFRTVLVKILHFKEKND